MIIFYQTFTQAFKINKENLSKFDDNLLLCLLNIAK